MALDPKQLAQIDGWMATGDPKRAETQVARLLRGDVSAQERAQLLFRRARARILLERPEEALEDLQTLRALDSTLATGSSVLELLADANFARFELAPVGFAERSDAIRARELYEAIERSDPNYTNLGWVLYQWGRVLLSEGNVEAALDCFTQALIKPSTVQRLTALVYERLGFIHLMEKRDPAVALSFFSRAVTTYPVGEPSGWLMRLHLLRSRAYREQRQYDEAIQAAQIAFASISPSEPHYRAVTADAHLMLGELLCSIPGREREAADHLLQFIQQSRKPQGVDVTWSRIHEMLGDLWFRLGRYEQAIAAYQTALGYNPYHPWEIQLYYEIARSYYRLRQYEQVIVSIDHILKLSQAEQQPLNDHRVFGLLANAYFALEQFAESATAFRRAIELAPADAESIERYKTYLKAAEELVARR